MAGNIVIKTSSDPSLDNSEITEAWFGGIQTGFHAFDGFQNADEALGISTIRWPGGHLAETRPEVYGLDIPGLFDATDLWVHNTNRVRPDLADSFEYAIDNDAEFSVVIPTARYSNDIDTGVEHLRNFLSDLFTGEYGELPRRLTLEIGNEYHAQAQFAEDPSAYGAVAARFVEIINEFRDMSLGPEDSETVSIAVQMGVSRSDNALIIEEFAPEDLLAVDTLVFHALPISLRNLNRPNTAEDDHRFFDRIEEYYSEWAEAIEASGGSEPELFMSAWTVGGAFNQPDGVDLFWHDYGLRGASTALELFAGSSSVGVDAAAVWGIDVANLNSLYYEDGEGETDVSHVGTLFEMMSRNVAGKRFLGQFEPHSREDEVMIYSFGDGKEIAAYIAVNDIDSNGKTFDVTFEGVMNFSLISATTIGTTLESDFAGSIDDVEARIYEIPVVNNTSFEFIESGIAIDFTQDYQVTELILQVRNGFEGSMNQDWIQGSLDAEIISGMGGADYLRGMGGADVISGGKGDDTVIGGEDADFLYGNNGNDLIFGRDGNDRLGGGSGSDRLHGGQGGDVLSGGDGNDRLWGGTGNDRLYGGQGSDVLSGGEGDDSIHGGPGGDRFVIGGTQDQDTIFDFEIREDVLDLRQIIGSADKINIHYDEKSQLFQNTNELHDDSIITINVSEVEGGTLLNFIGPIGEDLGSVLLKNLTKKHIMHWSNEYFGSRNYEAVNEDPQLDASYVPKKLANASAEFEIESAPGRIPNFWSENTATQPSTESKRMLVSQDTNNAKALTGYDETADSFRLDELDTIRGDSRSAGLNDAEQFAAENRDTAFVELAGFDASREEDMRDVSFFESGGTKDDSTDRQTLDETWEASHVYQCLKRALFPSWDKREVLQESAGCSIEDEHWPQTYGDKSPAHFESVGSSWQDGDIIYLNRSITTELRNGEFEIFNLNGFTEQLEAGKVMKSIYDVNPDFHEGGEVTWLEEDVFQTGPNAIDCIIPFLG